MLTISIFSNNQVQANTLMSTLNNYFENNSGMLYPVPYLNLLIYYYLKNGKIIKTKFLVEFYIRKPINSTRTNKKKEIYC